MPDKPLEDDFEEESTRLAESLKNCRSVVKDYRAILTGEIPSPDASKGSKAGQ